MKYVFSVLMACLTATSVAAHPHIFVDTGLEAIFDPQGRLTHVRVTWQYDELFSLLITEDMGLDSDFDGILTDAEQAKLTGFDMNWIEGYNGDLEVMNGALGVPLSRPTQGTAAFADGRITTTHLRSVLDPVLLDGQLVIKPYDPTYYTAYDVTLPLLITGTDGCRARVKMPDINAGLKALREELSTLSAEADPQDAGLPNIGEQLASEVIVTCSAS